MSVLGDAIDFLRGFGIFDVLLPFLLVFAVVFGILEKTRIFGEETIGKVTYSRKNLNALVAFVLAMLVVAATKIVGIINTALPLVSLLVIVALSFLLMIGIFMNPGNTLYEKLSGGWMTFLMMAMFVAVVLIFLGNIPANEKESLLRYAINYITEFWSGTLIATLILVVVIVWAIFFITKGDKGAEGKRGKE